MDEHLNEDARCEASGLLQEMKKLETVILLVKWQNILKRFNTTGQNLQERGLDLHTIDFTQNTDSFF